MYRTQISAEISAKYTVNEKPEPGTRCQDTLCRHMAKHIVISPYGRENERKSVCGTHRNELLRRWQERANSRKREEHYAELRRQATISDNLAAMLSESLTLHFGVPVSLTRQGTYTVDISMTPDTARALLDVLGNRVHTGRTTRND